uniref:Secreted protein n=1 Tax=Parastrongyloides trichosuri TaxID=131310 RepID=A0A0N4ZZW7_PARTI
MTKLLLVIPLIFIISTASAYLQFSQLGYPYQYESVAPYTNLYSLSTSPLEVKYPSSFHSMYYGLGSNVRPGNNGHNLDNPHKRLSNMKMSYAMY